MAENANGRCGLDPQRPRHDGEDPRPSYHQKVRPPRKIAPPETLVVWPAALMNSGWLDLTDAFAHEADHVHVERDAAGRRNSKPPPPWPPK